MSSYISPAKPLNASCGIKCKHEKSILCRICFEPTTMLGTKLCDRCWELEKIIMMNHSIARKILASLGELKLSKSKKYIVNGRVGQYELTTELFFKSECFFMDDTNKYEYFENPVIKDIS